jgi:hypothetical protein
MPHSINAFGLQVAMTEGNDINFGGLAAALGSRLTAESRIATAVGFAWLCGGAAISLFLSGLGVAFALYGYSNTVSARPAAELIAEALTKALEGAELKTTVSGTMSLAPAELKLADHQKVRLEDGAVVKLDPNSSVRIIGDLKVDMPQPSKQQLQLSARAGSDEVPFTTYTIFTTVKFGSGAVETGWNFDLSDTVRPKFQFCYYRQDITKGLTTKYVLAVNDSPRRPGALQKLSFDFDSALSNCTWFSGF